MSLRLATVLLAAGVALAACQPPQTARTSPSGTASGVDAPLSAAANQQAGQGCPATTQGMPQLATRGEGPVVLRTSPGVGGAGRPGVAVAPGTTTTDHCN
jgi:hypothetical protein